MNACTHECDKHGAETCDGKCVWENSRCVVNDDCKGDTAKLVTFLEKLPLQLGIVGLQIVIPLSGAPVYWTFATAGMGIVIQGSQVLNTEEWESRGHRALQTAAGGHQWDRF